MLSDEWLSRSGLLENFNASVTRTRTRTGTGTGTWTTGVTAIALCTSCSRAKNGKFIFSNFSKRAKSVPYFFFLCIIIINIFIHAILQEAVDFSLPLLKFL